MQIVQEVGVKRIAKYILFTGWQTIFDLLPFSPLRVFWLKLGGAKVGANTVIDKIDLINLDRIGLAGLTLGQWCFLGRGVLLDLAGRITLEDWVTISPRVVILSHTSVGLKAHPLYSKVPPQISHTHLDKGCFIGASTTIINGVTVGATSIVGAGSVVIQDILSGVLAAGNPAVTKRRL